MGWRERLGRIVGTSGSPTPDLLLAAAVTGFAGLIWWESRKIPPPFFDPLGSAALPRAMALVMVVLAALMAARAVATLGGQDRGEPLGYRRRPDIAVGIFVLCIAYVGAMDLGWVGFEAATIAFLVVASALLGRLHLRTLMLGAVMAVLMGIGATWLFTRFFFIDLPR